MELEGILTSISIMEETSVAMPNLVLANSNVGSIRRQAEVELTLPTCLYKDDLFIMLVTVLVEIPILCK
jgi:hypothetical protein